MYPVFKMREKLEDEISMLRHVTEHLNTSPTISFFLSLASS